MHSVDHWIFDLDDTLYFEKDYLRSAFQYLGLRVKELFLECDFGEDVLKRYEQGVPDPIGSALSQRGLPEVARMPLINAMRSHQPNISLSAGAETLLTCLRERGRSFGIVTDGRSVTQRAKLAALRCLDAQFISISEEVDMTKRNVSRFAAVADAFPPGKFCYIGDNPTKDFWAPRQLGWSTVMLSYQSANIHPQTLPLDKAYHPAATVSDLMELVEFV